MKILILTSLSLLLVQFNSIGQNFKMSTSYLYHQHYSDSEEQYMDDDDDIYPELHNIEFNTNYVLFDGTKYNVTHTQDKSKNGTIWHYYQSESMKFMKSERNDRFYVYSNSDKNSPRYLKLTVYINIESIENPMDFFEFMSVTKDDETFESNLIDKGYSENAMLSFNSSGWHYSKEDALTSSNGSIITQTFSRINKRELDNNKGYEYDYYCYLESPEEHLLKEMIDYRSKFRNEIWDNCRFASVGDVEIYHYTSSNGEQYKVTYEPFSENEKIGFSVNIVPEPNYYAGIDEDWYTNLNDAYNASKSTGKPILFNFTSTIGCGWCTKHNKVLLQESFKSWSYENVILLEINLSKDLPNEQYEANLKLMQDLQIESYPFTLIGYPPGVGEEGGSSWVWKGYISGSRNDAELFIKELETIIENN